MPDTPTGYHSQYPGPHFLIKILFTSLSLGTYKDLEVIP